MAFTGVPACLLAELPKGSPHIEGFGEFVASFAAPITTGWSDLAGRELHPLKIAVFSRRTSKTYVPGCGVDRITAGRDLPASV